MDRDGDFAGLIALHQQLLRMPEPDAVGTVLYPRPLSVSSWQPTFDAAPYRPVDSANLGLEGTDSFHDLSDQALCAATLRVIDGEGPVHFDMLGDRLLAAADVTRMGSRIRARIEAVLAALASEGEIVCTSAFSGRREQFLRPCLRDWRPLPDRERQLERVADSELMLCLFRAVLDRDGIDVATAMNDGLHDIGFIRLTDNARERLQAPLQALLERRMLVRVDGGLAIGREAFVRPMS